MQSQDEPCEDGEEREEECVEEMSEEELLMMLDAEEDPHITCCRLFDVEAPHQLSLLKHEHVEALKTSGHVIIDDFIQQESAASLYDEAMKLRDDGALQPGGKLSRGDAQVRNDLVCWLHSSEEPASSHPSLAKALGLLADLRADLATVIL
mmetsp:Transcript_3697/g.8099  ORF Transcript_3697/g.8099 Transcript_3697/m.8099 type:complete len:151 (+) Transcript_3697:53-505(+)